MKEAVMKVIDTLTQEDFHEAFQKLLERHNKCIAAGGDYWEGDKSFMCVLSINMPIRKKSGNLFNDPRIYNYLSDVLGIIHKNIYTCVGAYIHTHKQHTHTHIHTLIYLYVCSS